jgi:HD-GYP domain-containing protein (c-di-GMP phosphodiesterase class II)
MAQLDYTGYDPAMRRYLLAVSCGGPLVVAVVVAAGFTPIDGRVAVQAFVLMLLAGVAERYPLHLTHKTNVNVATAAHVAMLLMLPSWLPGLLASAAIGVAQVARARTNGNHDGTEMLFNIGQTALYVSAGALAFAAADRYPTGPELTSTGSLGALLAGAAVMHLCNTALVAGAAGLQLGTSPLRVWTSNLSLDLAPHVILTVLGVAAAMIVAEQPLVLPFVALPVVLVHRSVGQTIRLRLDTREALASLVEVVELRDPYTAGHSRRVATTARLLAERLGLTAEEADLIESTGSVHDIGKVAIDPTILTKPGKLTEAEWAEVRRHPGLGADVLERFAAYRVGAAIVRHHHEAWDGTGYPDGLAGDTIPLGARILAVADTFDALTSDRPYRSGFAVPDAIEVLRGGAGHQWDARIVEAMIGLVQEAPAVVPHLQRDQTDGNFAAVRRATVAA